MRRSAAAAASLALLVATGCTDGTEPQPAETVTITETAAPEPAETVTVTEAAAPQPAETVTVTETVTPEPPEGEPLADGVTVEYDNDAARQVTLEQVVCDVPGEQVRGLATNTGEELSMVTARIRFVGADGVTLSRGPATIGSPLTAGETTMWKMPSPSVPADSVECIIRLTGADY